MPLRFYNTLTQQLEEFAPARDNTVRMYTCGPTVYDFAHIGNFRTFVFVDVLRRWLRAAGFGLNHVMNITDVDDRIIQNAVAQQKPIEEYTATYTKAFLDDCATLRLERPEKLVRATEHIPDMVAAIRKTRRERSTPTPATARSISASPASPGTASCPTPISAACWPARAWTPTSTKRTTRAISPSGRPPRKASPSGRPKSAPAAPAGTSSAPSWPSEYLGETLDMHAGGVDLIFPHHENEIAQSESLTGKPFARFWLHSEFLLVEGQKMSKSLGNFFTLRDLVARGYAPEAIRYLLASVPYRKALNFTFDGLKSAATAIERLRNFKLRLETDKFAAGADPEMEARTAARRRRVHRRHERRPQHRRGPGRRLRVRARRQYRHGRGRLPGR